MQTDVKFTGFGGQGILLSGKILGIAAMEQGYHSAWIPSYGVEMRGGTAYCTVVIGDKRIGSPIVENPSHLVAMNRPSLEKFARLVKPGGIILINSSIIPCRSGRDDITEIVIPANEAAMEVGTVKCANIIALSAFAAKAKVVDLEVLKETVKREFAQKPKLVSINMAAFNKGIDLAAQN